MVIGKLRAVLSQIPKHSDKNCTSSREIGKRFSRCILHIGTEKTGTSTIQWFLANNRKALARDGVIYPSATGKNGGTQWGFAGCVQPNTWKTDVGEALGINSVSDQKQYRENLQATLLREFESTPEANVLIISSEHLHSRLSDKNVIIRLKEFLEPWVESFEIVLYLRRQDRMAVSLYSTKIKSGNANPVLFPGAPKGPVPYYFDYNKIYDNWCAIFGDNAMRVRLFSPNEWVLGDLIQDFCAVCGLQSDGKRMPEVKNESINRMGADFLLEANKQLPRFVEGQKNIERVALAQFVSHLCRGKSYPANREEAMKFYQRFVDGNEKLRKKVFPERSEPLFDEDFSDYTEKSEQLEPRYEDAVKLAIRMWREKN